MSRATVTIHVEPHVAHWLTTNYGKPVELPAKSTIKEVFLTTLSKSFHPSRDYDKAKLTASVEVYISRNHVSEHGVSTIPGMQHYLNRVFNNHINMEICQFILASRIQGVKLCDAIKTYHFVMGYEDTLSPRAIEERYDRMVTSKNNFLQIQAKNKSHVSATT